MVVIVFIIFGLLVAAGVLATLDGTVTTPILVVLWTAVAISLLLFIFCVVGVCRDRRRVEKV